MAQFWDRNKTGDESETGKNIFIFELVKKNILVTGSHGQLGNEIMQMSKGHEDRFNFFFTDVHTLDITDFDAVNSFVAENKIQYIINCAAYTAVDKAEDETEICYKINRDAVVNLGIAATNGNAKVIHISTDYVFDGEKDSPYNELDPTSPKSIYGKSKVEGEVELLKACPNSIIIRTSWLYSPFGNNFVKTMIKLGRERESINVVSDQHGSPTYAGDLAKTIMRIVEFSESNGFKTGIYHYSNEGAISWYEFTQAIQREAGITTCQVNPITTDEYPTKASRPKCSVLDKSKIKKTFNISIPQWENSLKICVKELLSKE